VAEASQHLRRAIPPGANGVGLALWTEGASGRYLAETSFPSLEYPGALLLLIALGQYRRELIDQVSKSFGVSAETVELHVLKFQR
jgi:hypothetical protein